ncbi:hypothetical protein FJU30_13780 [Affinibrenneria salicis]|uniref:Immunity protein 22 n=1 Tax=Affinibrenneria salicis TaxID=2590031 RepID=A0A5J5FYZ0_9GAMM|nr:immunity 22 family protein [Affinibrenneria salicis]KAA8999401.1 hypothetical protein FJU30_13780 [Affinibrenneria salicis]
MANKYGKVHLWIGSNFSREEEYMQYFALDYSVEGDFDDPNYQLCAFCKDIGLQWYDEDQIGIIPRFEHEVGLDEILAAAAIDDAEKDRAKAACRSHNINQANAIFWYADADLILARSGGNSYNGLKYIGLFDGD